jgi:hypothetical protein
LKASSATALFAQVNNFSNSPRSSWNETFHSLKIFVIQHGELPKCDGTRHDGEESKLALFVSKQRYLYKRSRLHLDRIKLFEEIPSFSWCTSIAPFEKRVENLLDFIYRYDEYPRRGGKRLDGLEAKLASFVNHQRVLLKKNELSSDRVIALQNIPGFQSVRNVTSFEHNVKDIKSFIRIFNELPRHRGNRFNDKEHKLAKFLNEQKLLYRKGLDF